MKITIKTYLVGEAAFICRLALDGSYDWGIRLANWRGKGQLYGGPGLLPTTTITSPLRGPLYFATDLTHFITHYKAHDRRAQRCMKPKARYVEIDTGRRSWKVCPSRLTKRNSTASATVLLAPARPPAAVMSLALASRPRIDAGFPAEL
jgi:hypothetical protein